MKSARIEMVGKRFGRLAVLAFAENKAGRARWSCRCDCGSLATVPGKNMRAGITKSCGCLHREMTAKIKASHGMSSSGTYATWSSIQSRCYNPNQECYAKYGALGVRVCERWRNSFENFLADMGPRPPGMTIDRKNPFGDYEPSNCKWSTCKEQGENKRGHVAIAILEHLKNSGHGHLIDEAFKARYEPAKAFEDGYTRIEG